MSSFLGGMITMGFLIAGLFFLFVVRVERRMPCSPYLQ